MAVKIRLSRHGKKGNPFYHIVVADSRSPRDGRFIEKIGTYNPTANPAVIDLNVDKAVSWLSKGALPTDTCRAILSYKGALYLNHLNKGVLKGALTEDQAKAKFEKWLSEKEGKIQGKKDKLSSDKNSESQKRLAAEKLVREAKEKAIIASQTVTETVEETPAEEAPAAETATEESSEENA